jgi:hypothetical protein
MLRMDRLGITVSLVMLGLVLTLVVPLPSREVRLVFLGSDLTLVFSGTGQFALLMAALVCAGVDAILRTHPAVRRWSLVYTVTFWVLPVLLTVTSLLLLRGLVWWAYRVVLIGFAGFLLALVIVSQYYSVDPQNPRHRPARLILNGITYGAALVLFVFLYGSRLRSAISATGVAVASAMLALELLRSHEPTPWRTWLYAGVTGLLMGEWAWALNYAGLDPRAGGALLLLIFFAATGLAQQHLWGRLTRRVALEFALVLVAGLVLLFLLSHS